MNSGVCVSCPGFDTEAKEASHARDSREGHGDRKAVGDFAGTQSVAFGGEGDRAAGVDYRARVSGAAERADCRRGRDEPAAGRRVAAAMAGCVEGDVRLGMHRIAPATRSHFARAVRCAAAGGTTDVHRHASRANPGLGLRVAEVVGPSDRPLDAPGIARRGAQTQDCREHLGRSSGPLLPQPPIGVS